MRILVAASELTPLAKTGGLGDVLGALPRALARKGHEVLVFLPFYKTLNLDGIKTKSVPIDVQVSVGAVSQIASLSMVKDRQRGLRICLIHHPEYFDRDAYYTDPSTGKDYPDNAERFTFFCRAVLEAARALDFAPEIVHAHDWQAALLPALLKTEYKEDGFFEDTRSVMTIHNLAHQGQFEADKYSVLNLPEELMAAEQPFEFWGKVNFLKAGICFADHITTVSEKYAEEIQTEKFGCGLDGVLSNRKEAITGILNGVDYTVWSPSRDKFIPYRYHINNLGGKRMTRVELVNAAGLPVREKTPLIVQMIVLGTGDPVYHEMFESLQEKHPDRMRAFLRHDEALAHQIEAGADIFLMPSLFEPCGLNQMYSLKYGTIPLVHKVGGLADTVIPFDAQNGEGTGFVFEDETPEAMLEALDDAIRVFARKRVWTKLMKNGMRQDFSWDRAVDRYVELFDRTLSR